MPQNFAELVQSFLEILSLIVPLLFSLALLVIIWRLVDAWIINAGDVKKLEEGRKYALWGIIILVIMSTIWAILRLLRNSLFG